MSQQAEEAPVKGWNWGAFTYSWIWGIANETYLPLLVLIPGFNLFWIFVVGFKGNEWAWKKNTRLSSRNFNRAQATWNRAGWFALLTFMLWCALSLAVYWSNIPFLGYII